MAKVHPRFGTPGNALLIHGIWTSVLVLSGSFDMLTDMLIFLSYLFYGMSAVGIFVLRKKMPDAERPYKAWGYPVIPALYVLGAAAIAIVQLLYKPKTTWPGLIIVLTGIPVYFIWRKLSRPMTEPPLQE